MYVYTPIHTHKHTHTYIYISTNICDPVYIDNININKKIQFFSSFLLLFSLNLFKNFLLNLFL